MGDQRPAKVASFRLAGSTRDDDARPSRGAAAGAKTPSMPTWLAREAKAEWRRVVPRLQELGVLSGVDRAVLAAYCETWAEYQRAVKTVRKKGETIMTAKGYVAKHPVLVIRNEARTALAQYAVQLGLTPAARVPLRPATPVADGSTPENRAA